MGTASCTSRPIGSGNIVDLGFPHVLLTHLVEGEGGCTMSVLNTYRFTTTVYISKSTMD